MIIMCVYVCVYSLQSRLWKEKERDTSQSLCFTHWGGEHAWTQLWPRCVFVCVLYLNAIFPLPSTALCVCSCVYVCICLCDWYGGGRVYNWVWPTFVHVCLCLCTNHMCVLQEIGWWWLLWVCPWIHACNPFIPTAAVLSGDRKETAENKRLTHDGQFYNAESAPHNWWVNICDFCSFASHIAQTLIWITDLSQSWFQFLTHFFGFRMNIKVIAGRKLCLGAACMNPSSRDLPALLVFILAM